MNQGSALDARGDQSGPFQVGGDHLRAVAAIADAAADHCVADAVVGQARCSRHLGQPAGGKGPDPQDAREMRRLDIGDVEPAVAGQVGDADRREPAEPRADIRRAGKGRKATAIDLPDRQRGAPGLHALDGDDLGRRSGDGGGDGEQHRQQQEESVLPSFKWTCFLLFPRLF